MWTSVMAVPRTVRLAKMLVCHPQEASVLRPVCLPLMVQQPTRVPFASTDIVILRWELPTFANLPWRTYFPGNIPCSKHMSSLTVGQLVYAGHVSNGPTSICDLNNMVWKKTLTYTQHIMGFKGLSLSFVVAY